MAGFCAHDLVVVERLAADGAKHKRQNSVKMKKILEQIGKLRDGGLRPSAVYRYAAPPVFFLLILLVQPLSISERLENLSIDLRFRAREPIDPPPHPDLLLVGIDEASLERFGRWPWNRTVHADFCTLLAAYEPSVLAFDLLFTEPDRDNPESDKAFGAAAANLPRVVVGALKNDNAEGFPPADYRTRPLERVVGDPTAVQSASGAVAPIPELADSAHFGFVDCDPTSDDGIRRRVPMVVRVGTEFFPSFALKALMLHWELAPEQVEVVLGRALRIERGDSILEVPINAAGEMWLNERSPSRFDTWSYSGLFRALYFDATGERAFPDEKPHPRGRLIVVGQVAQGLTDIGPSSHGASMPLMLVWLNALDNIMQSDFLVVAPFWSWPGLLWLVTAWGSLILLRREGVALSIWIPLAALGVIIVGAFLLFGLFSLVVPVAVPVLAFVLMHTGSLLLRWFEEIGERRRVAAELALAEEERKRLEQELDIAREIQMSMLSLEFPAFPERSEIDHAIIEPAKFVGGDLFDFLFIDEQRLFFVLGDVAGKGLPAALFMTMALSVFRAHASQGLSPAEILSRSNDVLALRNDRCTFVTTFCGILDLGSGQLVYANGGHNPPVLFSADGSLRFLEEEGVALGAMEDMPYEEHELKLQSGEGLFIYTDGVTEAHNIADELYEDERLEAALAKLNADVLNSSSAICARVRADLATFVAEAPPFDDITMLCLLYKGR